MAFFVSGFWLLIVEGVFQVSTNMTPTKILPRIQDPQIFMDVWTPSSGSFCLPIPYCEKYINYCCRLTFFIGWEVQRSGTHYQKRSPEWNGAVAVTQPETLGQTGAFASLTSSYVSVYFFEPQLKQFLK